MTDAQIAAAIIAGGIATLLLAKGLYAMLSSRFEKISRLKDAVAEKVMENATLRSDLRSANNRIAELEAALAEIPEIEAIADQIIASLENVPVEEQPAQ